MLNSADFRTPNSLQRFYFFSNRNAAWVSKWEEYRNYAVVINASWVFFRFFKERFLKLCRFFRCSYSQWTFCLSRRRLEDFLKTSWKPKIVMLKTSSRRIGDKENNYWGYLYLTNLNPYLTNLTNLYLANLNWI